MSLSSVRRATSRRNGSNDERTTACGVSSMMKSTPVRCSSDADVPALAADDPSLEVVGRELDDGDRRLGRVAGGDPLQRVCDQRSRAPPRVAARLFLHLPNLARELVPDEVLRPLENLLARLLRGQAGDLLERRERLPMRLAELLLERLDVHLPVAESLLLALDLDEAAVRLELLLEDALLDLRDLDAAILHLGLDLAPQLHRLLARLDLRLAPDGIRLAPRLARAAARARPLRCARASATGRAAARTPRVLRPRFR